MQQRALLAGLLSLLFLIAYSHMLSQQVATRHVAPAPSGAQEAPPVAAELHPAQPERVYLYPAEHEEMATIESPVLMVGIGQDTGGIRRVTLKQFAGTVENEALTFGGSVPFLAPRLDETDRVESVSVQGRTADVLVRTTEGNDYHIIYDLDSQNTMLHIKIYTDKDHDVSLPPIQLSWTQATDFVSNQNRLESFALVRDADGKEKQKTLGGPVKADKNVPRGTFLLALAERHFCQIVSTKDTEVVYRLIPSPPGHIAGAIFFEPVQAARARRGELNVYLGPRDFFRLRDVGLERAFPVGMIGQIGLVLLLALSWVAKLTHNYGVAIIVFSAAITAALAPFTLIQFRSMKKMQELKPRIDQLMKQHKDDPKRMQQETFALYREHRVSPLGGCLPMLMQIPIFIAMFRGISHFIELRGAEFLWIRDLSLPDRIAELPFALPILGSDVNLLPAIMAAIMYFQTKFSQKGMASGEANPAAKMMSGPLMPIIFFVMFYQFPAGLVLYWLTNSAMSLIWYRMAK